MRHSIHKLTWDPGDISFIYGIDVIANFFGPDGAVHTYEFRGFYGGPLQVLSPYGHA